MKENKTQAWYLDPFKFHSTTDHCGANNSTRKKNGRGLYLQKREIPDPGQRAGGCRQCKSMVMPVEVCARGFIGSSGYEPLTKLSI